MTDRAEYQRRKAHNAPILKAIQDWLANDCDQREQVGAFGEVAIRYAWENGKIVVYHIEPKLTGKSERHNLTGGGHGADSR